MADLFPSSRTMRDHMCIPAAAGDFLFLFPTNGRRRHIQEGGKTRTPRPDWSGALWSGEGTLRPDWLERPKSHERAMAKLSPKKGFRSWCRPSSSRKSQEELITCLPISRLIRSFSLLCSNKSRIHSHLSIYFPSHRHPV